MFFEHVGAFDFLTVAVGFFDGPELKDTFGPFDGVQLVAKICPEIGRFIFIFACQLIELANRQI